MEASYQVDQVTRYAGTNKRSVHMEPSYSAFICLTLAVIHLAWARSRLSLHSKK